MVKKRKVRARAGDSLEISEHLNKRPGVGTLAASAWDLVDVTNKPPDHIYIGATMERLAQRPRSYGIFEEEGWERDVLTARSVMLSHTTNQRASMPLTDPGEHVFAFAPLV